MAFGGVKRSSGKSFDKRMIMFLDYLFPYTLITKYRKHQ